MTEKERIMKTVEDLNTKSLIDLAIRLDVVKVHDMELWIRCKTSTDIRKELKDMAIIKG